MSGDQDGVENYFCVFGNPCTHENKVNYLVNQSKKTLNLFLVFELFRQKQFFYFAWLYILHPQYPEAMDNLGIATL